MQKGSDIRKADYPIDDIFINRWSPRAMSGESITKEELMTLFEAARWAPSSDNEQPWNFVYATRDSEHWDKFFNLLIEFNQLWCENAAVLCCLVAKKTMQDGKPNYHYFSDSGAAWENLALQASIKGLVCHGMAGFDKEKATKELNIDEEHQVVHMFAIGKPGDVSVLHERMQKSEKPNNRKKVSEFVFEGSM